MTGTPYTPPVTRATFRRSARAAVVVGLLGLAVLVPTGLGMVGLFGCVGLALGMLNSLLAMRSVARFAGAGTFTKTRFSGSVFLRLALVTLLALGCALLFPRVGLAVFGGLVVFQVLAVASSMLPLIKEIRQMSDKDRDE